MPGGGAARGHGLVARACTAGLPRAPRRHARPSGRGRAVSRGVPWWKAEGIAKRDAALRELYQRFHSDAAPWRAAGEIERQTKIYETGRWRRDKDRNEMPAAYSPHDQEYLWRAFKSGAQMPVARRRLLDILS